MANTEFEGPQDYRRVANMRLNCSAAERAFRKHGIGVNQFITLQKETGLTALEEMGAWRPLHPTDIIGDERHIIPIGDKLMVPARKYGPGPDSHVPSLLESEPTMSPAIPEAEPIELYAEVNEQETEPVLLHAEVAVLTAR